MEPIAIFYEGKDFILVDALPDKSATITYEQIDKFAVKHPNKSIYLTLSIKSRKIPWYRKLRSVSLSEMIKIKALNEHIAIYEKDL